MAEATIMLVDDDDELRGALARALGNEGFDVLQARDGEQALAGYREADLVVLDVMLPELDGFEVCRLLREQSQIPVILLTAKGDAVDKRIGFTMGADDYIVKPFSTGELVLRIRAVLRRVRAAAVRVETSADQAEVVREAGLLLDRTSYRVTARGQEVHLTATEFELLWTLASAPGRVFTRNQLFDALWGEQSIGEPKTITVLIRKIREKIEADPAHPVYVQTVWGVGYKFVGKGE